MMARRDATDPREQGLAPNWAFSWPVNRRIMYNRASADPSGKPWNPAKPLIQWNGSAWTGIDVPDYAADQQAGGRRRAVHHAGGRHGAGCSRATRCARARSPSTTSRSRARCANPLHPKVAANPVARVFAGDAAEFGSADKFPYVATTYRLTEHFHFWTKHAKINAILQPEEFIEIGEALAKEKGIAQGDWVKLSSNRGFVVAKAYVTKRLKPMTVDGKATTPSACRSTGASPAPPARASAPTC